MSLSFPQCLERAFRIDYLFPRSATPKGIEWRDSRCRKWQSRVKPDFPVRNSHHSTECLPLLLDEKLALNLVIRATPTAARYPTSMRCQAHGPLRGTTRREIRKSP